VEDVSFCDPGTLGLDGCKAATCHRAFGSADRVVLHPTFAVPCSNRYTCLRLYKDNTYKCTMHHLNRLRFTPPSTGFDPANGHVSQIVLNQLKVWPVVIICPNLQACGLHLRVRSMFRWYSSKVVTGKTAASLGDPKSRFEGSYSSKCEYHAWRLA